MNHPPILTVTGTKGKTTVVGLVSVVLQKLGRRVLHVDTSGHFIDGERRSNQADSLEKWGIRTVTAAPGRYLTDFEVEYDDANSAVAVLEASFSSSTTGLGYEGHKVGAFLNVFEDHINPEGKIKTRLDLAQAKSFIFSAIQPGGYAVFNADDEMVCRMLDRLPKHANIHLIPCGKEFKYFDLEAHKSTGGAFITLAGNQVIYEKSSQKTVLCDFSRMEWAFYGQYEPLAENIMFSAAILVGYFDEQIPKDLCKVIETSALPADTGRLVVLKARNGATIITDYAHERVSLAAVARLGRRMLHSEGGKLRVVARLSHERPDPVIYEIGRVIGSSFDDVIIYDKIDGHLRHPRPPFKKAYPQKVGRVSEILSVAAKTTNRNVTRILREDEAIKHAAQMTTKDDVVIVILNDDIERSIGFIKKAFGVIN